MAKSKGDLCAFIDSDAFPDKDWLGNAVKYFKDPSVGAVGGPNLTPESDGLRERASGYVISSFMVGGLSRRHKHGVAREVDDIPSSNFIARPSLVKALGGWNEHYWPGEDTLMCLKIAKIGYRMLQTDDVVVYHRRRPLYLEHLSQVSHFGLHRGFFARKFAGNSIHFTYFLPSISLVALVLLGSASLAFTELSYLFATAITVYVIASLLATLRETTDRTLVPLVWAGICLTHFTYALFFIGGLLKRQLQR
jgi:cellulose synthase/poly-beta-1,6-N-acetylglucosamine synthase-like glycosyltransferase